MKLVLDCCLGLSLKSVLVDTNLGGCKIMAIWDLCCVCPHLPVMGSIHFAQLAFLGSISAPISKNANMTHSDLKYKIIHTLIDDVVVRNKLAQIHQFMHTDIHTHTCMPTHATGCDP